MHNAPLIGRRRGAERTANDFHCAAHSGSIKGYSADKTVAIRTFPVLCMANWPSRGNQGPRFFSTLPFPGEILVFSMADRCRYVDSRRTFFVQ
jgi:hypothetical protein